MEVIRTIHPIGQGAFYTERIIDDVHTFNIVFDCGAGLSNTPDDWLKKEISSYYTKNDVIDLLFISHFDKDHINGISELKKTKERGKGEEIGIDCKQNTHLEETG